MRIGVGDGDSVLERINTNIFMPDTWVRAHISVIVHRPNQIDYDTVVRSTDFWVQRSEIFDGDFVAGIFDSGHETHIKMLFSYRKAIFTSESEFF